ncbi:MAG: hypothetical protein JNL28_02875 [Planctomycetes bacterium]|nr:hypothetical protein [Planctomycetota bacterium]
MPTSSMIRATLIIATLAGLSSFLDDEESIATQVLKAQLEIIKATKPADPVILRLDEELAQLEARAKKLPEARQVAFLAAGLSPQQGLYATFGMPDLNEFSKLLLGKAHYPKVDLHREAFAGRDLSAEIRAAYQCCAKAHGGPLPRAPLYKVAFGYQRTTNAQMQGIDSKLQRHIVVLNRSALAPGRLWDAAIIHETWHCFQPVVERNTLWERALHEGVVTHLTQVVNPTLDDATVVLWSKEEWDAAMKHKDAIVKAFAVDRASADQSVISNWMILGKGLPQIPEAPSRCGYFVALLASRAWQAEHPDKGPAELIAAPAEEIWQAFTKKTAPK